MAEEFFGKRFLGILHQHHGWHVEIDQLQPGAPPPYNPAATGRRTIRIRDENGHRMLILNVECLLWIEYELILLAVFL